MTKGPEAIINPDLLVWARETRGYDVSQASTKIGVSEDRIRQWENGSINPTVTQLRKAANVYKRPLAVFYLPERPTDFDAMRDYRKLIGIAPLSKSPDQLLEIRHAWQRRELAIELANQLGEEIPSFNIAGTLDDNPDDLADTIRTSLRISVDDQSNWRGEWDALYNWKEAVEQTGLLVFQTTKSLPRREVRGFSISEKPYPVIVANSGDTPRARIFTLIHELMHIVLNNGGVCDLVEYEGDTSENQRIETFCNRVAGALLVPAESLEGIWAVNKAKAEYEWSDEDLSKLARRYWVSRETILRRLLIIGKTTPDYYRQKRNEFLESYAELEKRPIKGYAPPYRKAISSLGSQYTKLVLSAYHREAITASDLSDFLGVRLKWVGQIEQTLFERSA